ncbi:hypothetical protein [Flavihumibacter sp. UBA7668]|uniref:hypothetical protein n=1 Tax=Flavihumibacter sp. UBA7668 TaxID=1946542 RepID=UPI0025BD4426|nr:hypothetical protein [Flavihumibacter sp. UBA7668]
MKKRGRIILFAFICSLSLVACDRSDDDDDDPTNTPANSVTNSYLIAGSWKVSLLTDDGRDETSDYDGYTFEFAADGKLTASKSGITTNGTWRTQRDDGSNELLIQLVTTDKDLDELNDDWDIVLSTNSKIELQDDNEERDEKLHFTKK